MRRTRWFICAVVVAMVASLTIAGTPVGALDGGTTCRTFGSTGYQSIEVVLGDGDSRTTFQFRNGRLFVDGTDCGQVLGRGTVDVRDGGDPSTNTVVFDASTRWSTGGEFAIPVRLTLQGHVQDGAADRLILRGSARRDVVEAFSSGNFAMRRGGQHVFTIGVEPATRSIIELRGGNDRFRYVGSQGSRPIDEITVRGGGGNDFLAGGAFGDRLIGGPGDDRLVGKGGQDFLSGGPGRDRLTPGGGADTVNGGRGTDTCRCNSSDTVTSVP